MTVNAVITSEDVRQISPSCVELEHFTTDDINFTSGDPLVLNANLDGIECSIDFYRSVEYDGIWSWEDHSSGSLIEIDDNTFSYTLGDKATVLLSQWYKLDWYCTYNETITYVDWEGVEKSTTQTGMAWEMCQVVPIQEPLIRIDYDDSNGGESFMDKIGGGTSLGGSTGSVKTTLKNKFSQALGAIGGLFSTPANIMKDVWDAVMNGGNSFFTFFKNALKLIVWILTVMVNFIIFAPFLIIVVEALICIFSYDKNNVFNSFANFFSINLLVWTGGAKLFVNMFSVLYSFTILFISKLLEIMRSILALVPGISKLFN